MKKNHISVKAISAFVMSVIVMLSLWAAPVYADPGIGVVIDGVAVEFDVEPVNVDGRVMVPVAAIFNALGCDDISWDPETQELTAIFPDETEITLIVGDTTAYINDEAITLDVAPIIIDDRTMVPTRFIAESANATVEWDSASSTVIVTTEAPDMATGNIALHLQNPVKAGNKATLDLQGNPSASYSISVIYSSGPSLAAGLIEKTADADGNVSWTWLVGSRTKSGDYDVVITDLATNQTHTVILTVTN